MISLASWILRTFGSGPTVETLIGDLTEEYQGGKSSAWLFGQALFAIAVTFFHEVRSHWVFVLRAVAFTCVLAFLWKATTAVVMPWVILAINLYVPEGEPYLATAYQFVNGVSVADSRTFKIPSHVAYYVPFARMIANGLGAWLTGALVGRLHRRHRNAEVLAVALTYTAYVAIVGRGWMRQVAPPEGAVIVTGLWMAWWFLTAFVSVAAFVIGGLGSPLRGMRSGTPALKGGAA